jgi:hypothetical protein
MGRIDGLRGVTEVRQYPFDDGRIFDARDHLELPAAAPADLDVDGKQHASDGERSARWKIIINVSVEPDL